MARRAQVAIPNAVTIDADPDVDVRLAWNDRIHIFFLVDVVEIGIDTISVGMCA